MGELPKEQDEHERRRSRIELTSNRRPADEHRQRVEHRTKTQHDALEWGRIEGNAGQPVRRGFRADETEQPGTAAGHRGARLPVGQRDLLQAAGAVQPGKGR